MWKTHLSRHSQPAAGEIFLGVFLVFGEGVRAEGVINYGDLSLWILIISDHPKIRLDINSIVTHWVSDAWEALLKKPDFMRSTFQRMGLSLPLNGSEDAEYIRFDGQGVDPISVDSDDDDSEDAQGDGVSSGDDLLSDQIKFYILKA